MPKKREVASLVGNLSPVKRRRAILVRRIRHFRGEIGEELNNRAVYASSEIAAVYGQLLIMSNLLGRRMSCPL